MLYNRQPIWLGLSAKALGGYGEQTRIQTNNGPSLSPKVHDQQ
jgi:hypothetical protein